MGEGGSGGGGMRLSVDGLARLDKAIKKRDRRLGLETDDEAYLAEVREREARMERERRRRVREERDEVERDREREREKERERASRRESRRRRSERVTDDDDDDDEAVVRREQQVRRQRRRERTRTNEVVDHNGMPETPPAMLHEEWKRKQKYQKLDERTPEDRHERKGHRSRKSRVISGPYLEDGRAEKVYKHEKGHRGGGRGHEDEEEEEGSDEDDEAARKAKRKKFICKLHMIQKAPPSH
jgi:hypothetical protein